jgi:hypothetical protein
LTDRNEQLAKLKERALRGINQARRARKYRPRGNFNPVEWEALTALIELDRGLGELLQAEET